MALEVYRKETPPEFLEAEEGSSLITIDTASREACMDAAVCPPDSVISRHGHYILQTIKIDRTKLASFAAVFNRTSRAGKLKVGPKVLDGWLTSYSEMAHKVVGFILMERPATSMGAVLNGATSPEDLNTRITKVAPAARALLMRIAQNSGILGCWPGPMLDPNSIGITQDGTAVVVDWSTCVFGGVPEERIVSMFVKKVKEFIDEVPIIAAERRQEAFKSIEFTSE